MRVAKISEEQSDEKNTHIHQSVFACFLVSNFTFPNGLRTSQKEKNNHHVFCLVVHVQL